MQSQSCKKALLLLQALNELNTDVGKQSHTSHYCMHSCPIQMHAVYSP